MRNISDTALWVTVYRARENERADAVFRDPFAARLAGERGRKIAEGMAFDRNHEWAYVARTYLVDQYVTEQVEQGVDLVLNLAAGLDSRPYRLNLPSTLRWIDVDLAPLLDYRDEILRNDKPICQLEEIRMDLADMAARRELFARLASEAKKILALTEGILIYLTAEEVAGLAADLSAPPSFQRWIFDLVSPGLLNMLQDGVGKQLQAAGASLKFAPSEGPAYFERFGWQSKEIGSILKTAGRLGRLPFGLWLISLLPDSRGRQGSRPWSGICLMEKSPEQNKPPS